MFWGHRFKSRTEPPIGKDVAINYGLYSENVEEKLLNIFQRTKAEQKYPSRDVNH